MAKHPAPPKDLTGPGRALWAAVQRDYELSTGESALLLEACRTKDELEVLRASVLDSPVLTTGSTKQEVVCKVYDELRKHRDSLTRLLTALDLPIAEVPAVPKPTGSARMRAV